MPNVVIVRKELPVNSLAELIAYIKANPGQVILGSQGYGATPHLTGMMFQGMTGTRMVHVPYRGETLVLNDMMGGHVDVFFGNVAAAKSLFRDGRVKIFSLCGRPALSGPAGGADDGRSRTCPGLSPPGGSPLLGPPRLAPPLQSAIADAALR